MHREEGRAAADQTECGVQVAVREVVAAVAHDHCSDASAGLGCLLGRKQVLAVELAARVRVGDNEERPPREAGRGVGGGRRSSGDDPFRIRGEARPAASVLRWAVE
jgi:hypothetical protein